VHAAEQAGQVRHYERHDRGAGITHRFRFINDMPLNECKYSSNPFQEAISGTPRHHGAGSD
jgi:hypothetical protein